MNIVSSYVNKTSFSVEDSSVSISDSNTLTSSYTYGSGTDQVTNCVSMTGVLSSGLSSLIDLTAIPQKTIGSTQNVAFTGIKHLSVYNKSETNGYNFTVCATGTNAFTNVFNGGSGNLMVKPLSSFSINSPVDAIPVSGTQKYLFLKDTGSGTSYKIVIFGLT